MVDPQGRYAGDDADVVDSDDVSRSGMSSDMSEEDSTWTSWFCSLRGHEFFVEVPEDYIQDEFNLTGLSQIVPYYDYALDTILDLDSGAEDMTEEQQELVDSAAEFLYGLIHARYVITSRGLQQVLEKYQDFSYGRCHRVHCEGQPMLPCGRSDIPRKSGVVLYCPRCSDVYYPKSRRHSKIDGAYFGTTLPHLLLMTYPELVPAAPQEAFRPRVFGFRVHCPAPDAIEAASSALAADGSAVRSRSLRSMLAVRELVERAAKARVEALVDGRVPHITVEGGAMPVTVQGGIDVAGVLAAAARGDGWRGGAAGPEAPGDAGQDAGQARGGGAGRASDGTGAAGTGTGAGAGAGGEVGGNGIPEGTSADGKNMENVEEGLEIGDDGGAKADPGAGVNG